MGGRRQAATCSLRSWICQPPRRRIRHRRAMHQPERQAGRKSASSSSHLPGGAHGGARQDCNRGPEQRQDDTTALRMSLPFVPRCAAPDLLLSHAPWPVACNMGSPLWPRRSGRTRGKLSSLDPPPLPPEPTAATRHRTLLPRRKNDAPATMDHRLANNSTVTPPPPPAAAPRPTHLPGPIAPPGWRRCGQAAGKPPPPRCHQTPPRRSW